MATRFFLQSVQRIRHVCFRPKDGPVLSLIFRHKWLLCNVFICGASSFVADVAAQYIGHEGDREDFAVDCSRGRSFTLTSLTLAPVVHYWYIYLDKVVAGKTSLLVAKKLIYDTCFFSPAYIFLFFGLQSLFEGKTPSECISRLNYNGPTLWITESVAWIPIQWVNFRFVSLTYRVLYDNVVSFCFDVLYSSMYHTEATLPMHV